MNVIGWGLGVINNVINWGRGAVNSINWGILQKTSPAGETEIYGVRQDADTTAFLTATGITDATITSALDTLVTDMKGLGIWDKMKAIYPFVGGTATTHKFNLKDPRDLDAAFRLQFNGGWTHSSTGALPNGTNAFADTFYNPAVEGFSNTNAHIGVYVVSPETHQNGRLIGVSNSTDDEPIYIIDGVTPSELVFGFGGNTGPTARSTQPKATGFLQLNRVGTTTKGSKDGLVVSTSTQTLASVTSLNFYLGCGRVQGYGNYRYSNRKMGYVTLGNGLTDTEAANLYTAVQKFQTTLNRQV